MGVLGRADNNYKNKNKGYIALMSAIIISSLLLVISVSLGMSGFFSRLNVLDSEYKQKSQALAEGCFQSALAAWALSSSVSSNVINIGGDACTILNVQNNFPANGQITINTTASYQQAVTNINAVVKQTDLSIVSIIYQ